MKSWIKINIYFRKNTTKLHVKKKQKQTKNKQTKNHQNLFELYHIPIFQSSANIGFGIMADLYLSLIDAGCDTNFHILLQSDYIKALK